MDGRGQVLLHAYVHYGVLTVHVLEARHLSCKRQGPCNAYIKVSLCPDHSRRAKCKTDISPQTNQPQFDEKFSFELLDEDLRKRLLISVWNKDVTTHHSEFLGSMSFGIQHFLSYRKMIHGWYYLLGDDLGQRKHLQVATVAPSSAPSQVYQEPCVKESHVFVLRRGPSGYGFSMVGDCPVVVSRIDPGSPADSMGVKREDAILHINGINVTHCQPDSVARIVRNCDTELVMEIERRHRLSESAHHQQAPPAYIPPPPYSKIKPFDETKENVLPSQKFPFFFCGAVPRVKKKGKP